MLLHLFFSFIILFNRLKLDYGVVQIDLIYLFCHQLLADSLEAMFLVDR